MTQQEFISAFMNPSEEGLAGGHERIFGNARERLRRLKDKERFDILFPIAVKKQGKGFPVCDAAILLRELSPECPISCEDAVRTLLPNWDVSIEEVPFYLAARFGSGFVRDTARHLQEQVANDLEKRTLDTIIYWVGIYEGVYPDQGG